MKQSVEIPAVFLRGKLLKINKKQEKIKGFCEVNNKGGFLILSVLQLIMRQYF